MADVDFSNAKIEPVNNLGGVLYNPTQTSYVSLESDIRLYDNALNTISTSSNPSQLVNEQKQLVVMYNGTFNASGTEFYIVGKSGTTRVAAWRIYNISFNSGDTYLFQINATLTCN